MLRIPPLGKGITAVLLFGSVPCTIRYIELDSIAIGVVRLLIAAIGLYFLIRAKLAWDPSAYSKREWIMTALGGIIFGLHWLFYFLGIKLASASLGALGFSTYGIQLILLGWLLRLNPVHPRHVLGVMLAVSGSILIIPEFSLESELTIGLLSGFLSGTFYALLPVLHKRNSRVPDDVRACGQFAFALLIFVPLIPFSNFKAPLFDWSLVVYLGVVVTLIAHTLWVHASTALPTTTTSIVSYLYLPAAIFLSWLLIDEDLTGRMLLGAGLILTGNLIGLDKEEQKAKTSA